MNQYLYCGSIEYCMENLDKEISLIINKDTSVTQAVRALEFSVRSIVNKGRENWISKRIFNIIDSSLGSSDSYSPEEISKKLRSIRKCNKLAHKANDNRSYLMIDVVYDAVDIIGRLMNGRALDDEIRLDVAVIMARTANCVDMDFVRSCCHEVQNFK